MHSHLFFVQIEGYTYILYALLHDMFWICLHKAMEASYGSGSGKTCLGMLRHFINDILRSKVIERPKWVG